MVSHSNLKALWRVSSPYTAPVTLRATDWISALGAALHQLGRAEHIDRMACERLPNGDLIINDLTHDCRYIVQMLAAAADLPAVDAGEEITEVRPLIGIPARRSPVEQADDDEILAMDDASEPTDPYAGWGMSLQIDPEEDLPSEERPLIETWHATEPQGAPSAREDAFVFEEPESLVLRDEAVAEPAAYEDAFSFEEDDLSDLSDTTLNDGSPRRGLGVALRLIRARRSASRVDRDD
jgi:hypothetical protein